MPVAKPPRAEVGAAFLLLWVHFLTIKAAMMRARRPPAPIPAYSPTLEEMPEEPELESDAPARRVDDVDIVMLGVEVVLLDP